jgi:outer membrane protein OmpA-like peptidoglycan-associated protein
MLRKPVSVLKLNRTNRPMDSNKCCRHCRFWPYFLLWALPIVPLAAWFVGGQLKRAISLQAHPSLANVSVSFQGQHAVLAGTVKDEAARNLARAAVDDELRAPRWWMLGLGSKANPVSSVSDKLVVTSGIPAVWATLAARDGRVRLQGEIPQESWRSTLTARAQVLFPEAKIEDQLRVTDKVSAMPALTGAFATGTEALAIPNAPRAAPAFAWLRSDASWQVESTIPADVPASLASHATSVGPDLEWLRATAPSKPSGWVAIAARDQEVRLRGEVPSDAIKQQMATTALAAYPKSKVIDNLVVNPNLASAAPETLQATMQPLVALQSTAEPNRPRQFAAATLGSPLVFAATAPGGDLAPLQKIAAVVPAGAATDIPWLIAPAAPAGWAALSALNSRLTLSGEVPTAAASAALARQTAVAYPRHQIENKLTIRESLAPWDSTAPTDFTPMVPFARALPLQPWDTAAGQLGFLRLGGSWKVCDFLNADPTVKSEIVSALGPDQATTETVWPLVEELRRSAPAVAVTPPYLSIISGEANGKAAILITGEVADEASKRALIEAAQARWPDRAITDGIDIAPRAVSPSGSLDATIASYPASSSANFVSHGQPGSALRFGPLHSIFFATGKAGGSREQLRALRQMRRVLSLWPSAKFEISGHTDSIGNVAANVALSQKRAEQSLDFVAAQGIPRNVLTARGAGPAEPIRPNTTEDGRRFNRRVDFTLQF